MDVPEDGLSDNVQDDEGRGRVFENLYQTLHSTMFNHRKTEGKDVGLLSKMVTSETRQTFRSLDIGKNLEKSCFSIVLTDMNDLNRLIAHASFSDIPSDPGILIGGKRWRKNRQLAFATTTNTLFMTIFVWRDDESMETCIEEILANTFCACETVEYLILECPSIDYKPKGYMFSTRITEVSLKTKSGQMKKIVLYSKDDLLPNLKIRSGRELDLDDLVPLLTLEVKDLEETFRKSFVVELISMSERTRSTYVAEHDGYAVGMITMSAEVNYTALNEQFHLEPFHGLCKPSESDEINCQPVESRLFVPKPSDVRLTETFQEKERGFSSRPEKSSLTDFDASTMSLQSSDEMSIAGRGDVDYDVLDIYLEQGVGLTRVSTAHFAGDYLKLTAHQSSKNRFVRGAYRRESIQDTEFANFDREVQEELLQKVEKIVLDLKARGLSLATAELDVPSIRILTEAQAFINRCIHRYLHKTLIDDSLLPIVNINEPPPSTFLGMPNAIALMIAVMATKYNVRILDMINGAFTAFPTRDYLIVTLPNGVSEPYWLKFFVRVAPKSTSLHPKSLYVLHRACFSTTLRYRRAKKTDCDKVITLLETLSEGKKILEDFKTSLCSTHNELQLESFVIQTLFAEGNIVALVIISPELTPSFYQVNYELDDYAYFSLHDPSSDHAYIHHFVTNPIFIPYSKLLIKEIMRAAKKDCFYHRIYPVAVDHKILKHQSLLNNLNDFAPLLPRRRIEYAMLNLVDTYDDLRQPPKVPMSMMIPSMAFYYSKKFTYEPKVVVSKRLVFIGASDTTLSCLAKILSTPYYDFKNLTLVSTQGMPGGLPHDELRNLFFPRTNGPALSMKSNEEWYQRLPIRFAVTTIYGTALRVLRKMKVVVVDNKTVVPYDLLVIATGRQFVRPDSPHADIIDERLDAFKESVGPSTEQRPIRHPMPPKPKNAILINSDTDAAQALNLLRSFIPFVSNRQVIVHGACLEAYCCVKVLIELGISPHRITFVTNPEVEMEWEEFHTYRDTPQLRALMMETFEELGMEVLDRYEFRRWNLDEATGICSRVYFGTTKKELGDRRPIKVSVPCVAYFAYSTRRVSDEIVTAFTSACLPYNNGIVINTQFETEDSSIMAAGSCTTYNKRLCADKWDHCHFSSYEVGQVLGQFILKRILPPVKSINVAVLGPVAPPFPLEMTSPLVHYAQLPGGWHYMHVSRPGWVPQCCRQPECKCQVCACGTQIVTGSVNRSEDPAQKYFRLRLDKYQGVEVMECISREKFPPAVLSSLYGHHVAFLNKLLERLEKNELNDLYEHFCQPWIAALGSDRWLSFRQELELLMANYQIGKGTTIGDFVKDYVDNLENPDVFKVDPNILRHVFENTNLKAAIESKFLNFLKYNKSVLPMYARPDFVEETYNERIASPMYVPQHKNFALE